MLHFTFISIIGKSLVQNSLHKTQSQIPFLVIVSFILAFTDRINEEVKFVKLLNISRTTVSSETIPKLQQTTSSPDKPPTTFTDSQHLTTTAKETTPESHNDNKEVM